MIDHREAGTRSNRPEDSLGDLAGALDRERNFSQTNPGAVALGDLNEGIAAGIVILVRGEDLVARPETNGPANGVHGGGGVGDKCHIAGAGTDKPGQFLARGLETFLVSPPEKLDRFRLHLTAQFGLEFQDLLRAGAERAVVQKGDAGRQQPVLAELRYCRACVVVAFRAGNLTGFLEMQKRELQGQARNVALNLHSPSACASAPPEPGD